LLLFIFFLSELLDDETDDHLEIDNLKITDDGIYRCLAKNKFGSAKLEFSVNIYEPARILMAQEELNTRRHDDSVKLSCISRGNPLPIISWILNGHIMTSTSKLNIEKLFKTVNDDVIYFDGFGNGVNYLDAFNIKLSKQKFYSQLTRIDSKTLKLDMIFKSRDKLQSNKYNCYSYNALGKDEKSVNLVIHKKPYVNEMNSQQAHDHEILETLPMLLMCQIDGEPTPKITWYKNGLQIYENETVKILNDNKVLSIAETFAWNSGNYSCVGRNDEGEVELKFNVLILSPPRFIDYSIITPKYHNDFQKSLKANFSDNSEIVNVIKGKDAVLECWIEASPKAKIHWLRISKENHMKTEIINENANFLVAN
jgi:hemicentin